MNRKTTVDSKTELIKELRARTGAGVMDCRTAVEQSGGDLEKAVELLRARGLATAAKKASRTASEGLVEAYVHAGGRVGAVVEVNCETDFVARTEEFKRLAHDVALQVTAAAPQYVSREAIPPDVVETQRQEFARELVGKPAAAVEGRLEKWFTDVVLLEQPFIRDENKRVRDLLTEAIAKFGENILVRRFARFKLGD
ncbi:MAG TPA: translation elongation factor Ts [bacterium]|nr:translation elongation factor Ts [bacterium]